MSARSFLDQLLQTGANAARNYNSRQTDMGRYASGAAAGGLLAVLLGTRTGRQLGGKALKLGSLAALGALAWNAYNEWQAGQGQGTAAAAGSAPPAALTEPQAEAHGRALLRAMIAAAKSDGHLDERERGLVDAELQRIEAPADLRSWVEGELSRSVDATAVAAGATGPEMAAEIYLASLLVVDETSAAERSYLDALAAALRLDAGLKAQLESRALAA